MKRLGDMYYSGTLPVTLAFVDALLTWYGIFGNMVQNGTPTQDNPIVPQECGDLVSSGEHAGEYSLLFTSDNVTTNIYLSEPIRKIGNYVDVVESSTATAMWSRVIRKKVFDGTEAFSTISSGANKYFRMSIADYPCTNDNACLCTHYEARSVASTNTYAAVRAHVPSASVGAVIAIRPENVSTMSADDLKAWLASEYANGTPVTVWYALETPVEESITATPIPLSGETTIDYDGTLAPSRFDINNAYGWGDVPLPVYTNSEWVYYKEKRRENGEWV